MNRFVEAIDDLHVLASKADRMRQEIRSGEYGDDRQYSISEKTTNKLMADLDDMACRIRLAVRKIMEGEDVPASRRVFVLSNTHTALAVYDDEMLAENMLCSVEDEEAQQNNSIEEFTLNQDPDCSDLLA